MAFGKKKTAAPEVEETVMNIQPLKMRNIILFFVGTSPLIMHRFAQKAWQELLYPSAPKNRAERASTLKHQPLEEYQGCFYRNRDRDDPALFHLPGGMIHKAIAAAALDIPGAARTEIGRWVQVETANINFFGTPSLFMSMVRNSDMKKTPDVRTRPIFEKWAFSCEFRFKADPLTDQGMVALAAAAGDIVGLGDWRPQRGGSFGRFRLTKPSDAAYTELIKKHGRAAQQHAYDLPAYHDLDTQDLMTWFTQEVQRRRQDDEQGNGVTTLDAGWNIDGGEEVAPTGANLHQ